MSVATATATAAHQPRAFFAPLDRLLTALRAAIAVSAAVERGERPAEAHLRHLGIDPASFQRPAD